MIRLFPRWCRLLMWEALVVGVITGHFYGMTHFRDPEPPPATWEMLAADAAAYASQQDRK
jgi:hypothetical protein